MQITIPGGRVVPRHHVHRAGGAQAAVLQHERDVGALPHRAERLTHLAGELPTSMYVHFTFTLTTVLYY